METVPLCQLRIQIMNPKNMISSGVRVNRPRPRSCTGKIAFLNTKRRAKNVEYKRTETGRVETGYFNFTDRQEGHDDCASSASKLNIAW